MAFRGIRSRLALLAVAGGLAPTLIAGLAGTGLAGTGLAGAGLAGAGLAGTASLSTASAAAGTPPGIDPAYIYAQLDYMVTHFQHREAGYRAGSAGHTGFARYWQRQMLALLGPFGARARSYPFAVRGWLGRPATAPAADVEVTVPGLADPAHEVIIGCHYDAEADSTESANDDASGCAIELGVAKAMAAYWRDNHLGPARTLRFVLFDAEEQGIFGSYEYVNQIARGDLTDMSAMINEEQNGIAYPLRYLGKSANPLMPLFAYVSPLAANDVYQQYSTTPRQRAGLTQLTRLLRRAVPATFRQFRAMGDQMLTYHRRAGPDLWRAVFTPAQAAQVHVLTDNLGSSDQVPFTAAGVRSAMFVGNSTYYQRTPPPGSYPYDRPQDTIALMNTFADGGSAASHALELALGLPGMLTTWLLSQPSVLGQARPDGRPAAAVGDVGVVLPGHPVRFDAAASYDPGKPGARLSYAWSFGDGQSASGRAVRHAYAAAGSYRLRLTVSAGAGRPRVITRRIVVGPRAKFANPYASLPQGPAGSIGTLVARGLPPANPAAVLPGPAPGRRDQVGTAAQARRLTARAHRTAVPAGHTSALPWAFAGAGVLALLGILMAVVLRTRRAGRTGQKA
jgi:hypothetical protein